MHDRNHRGASKLLTSLIFLLCSLTGCAEEERPMPPVKRLATDVHVMIGGHRLILPFAALEDFAYRSMSFSFDRGGDGKRAKSRADELLGATANRDAPATFDSLTVTVRTYGWNDFDMRQRDMCPLLTSIWARSVCNNPASPIQLALPKDRFVLVDLDHLPVARDKAPFNCLKDQPAHPLPSANSETVILCQAFVIGGSKPFFQVAVRIEGRLGAFWTVWGHGQNGEPAETMANREGKAIISFVHNALGNSEDFPRLYADMCLLKRPLRPNGSDYSGCPKPDVTGMKGE